MLNHVWSVICQSSSIDKQNNSISLFNCIESINIEKNKTSILPISFNIVNYWIIDNPKKRII